MVFGGRVKYGPLRFGRPAVAAAGPADRKAKDAIMGMVEDVTGDARGTAFSLLGGRLSLRQPARGYRVAIDPVFLAATVPAAAGDRILDVGCGVGAASLCLAVRVPGCTVQGIDTDPASVEMAQANAAANGLQDRVTFGAHTLGAEDARGNGGPGAPAGGFDAVMSNPPYLPPERADVRAMDADLRRAHVESVPLARWVAAMAGWTRPGGHLALIHRADRLDDILSALASVAGGVRVIPLWPRAGAPAKRVLVTAVKGSRAPLVLAAGLALHEGDGGQTPQAKEILNHGGPVLG